MGETIDLNDLNNIEEHFENVKLYGGVDPSSFPIFKVGEYVLYLAEKHRVKSKDGKYYNIINDKTGEEKRVYGTSIMAYKQRFFSYISDKLEVGLTVLNAGEVGTIKKIDGRKIKMAICMAPN